jgi:hypothetical protein
MAKTMGDDESVGITTGQYGVPGTSGNDPDWEIFLGDLEQPHRAAVRHAESMSRALAYIIGMFPCANQQVRGVRAGGHDGMCAGCVAKAAVGPYFKEAGPESSQFPHALSMMGEMGLEFGPDCRPRPKAEVA